MDANDIRVWCMQHPRPAMVRCTNADGLVQEVLVQGAWTKLADTIHALQPELLEAVNSEKLLIRALRPNDISEDWGDDEQPEARRPRTPTPSLRDIPITAADPETQRFALVAQLLADAYKNANDSHQTAFQHLVDIVNSSQRRSESVERAKDALHKVEVQRLRQQITEAGQEPEGSPEGELTLQSLLGAVLSGVNAGGGGADPAAAANGKGHS
jgi:hypothetical protein